MAMPLRPFRHPLLAAGAILLGGCVTSSAAPGAVVVRHWPAEPDKIIVPPGAYGRFMAADECIWFDFAHALAPTKAALFPPGTRLSDDRRAILLPTGRAIPFNRKVPVEFEPAPVGPATDRTCGRDAIEVHGLIDDPPRWLPGR